MLRLFLTLALFGAAVAQRSSTLPSSPANRHTRTRWRQAAERRANRGRDARPAREIENLALTSSSFHVQGGAATIEGRMDVIQRRSYKHGENGGAIAVVNHIQISDGAKQRAEAHLAKGRRAQIKRGDPLS